LYFRERNSVKLETYERLFPKRISIAKTRKKVESLTE
jgi:hypothetical protein